jgi:putative membrane protein
MTSTDPYSRFAKESLILRDELALDRTVLANERTFLAYLRTAVALVLAGVTFLHFSEALWFSAVGVGSLAQGIVMLVLGAVRFRQMRKVLIRLREPTPFASEPDTGES